ncbi:copper amine oxidase N-terminal domain-containing protein [Brevibacillus reuszeri]|uniref:copper amine oxidase N-terminal domain-containing protein n=1 Tax=Brevibacillus reuszeri TaxID=54915 RepID=UPI00366D441B
MFDSRLKYMVFSLLFVLMIVPIAQAAEEVEEFFWSESVPLPSCSGGSRGDGIPPGQGGVVIDGKKVIIEIPSCEEVKKTRVLVLVNGKYLHVRGVKAESAPFIENGRTMIPLRAMADVFGFQTNWEPSEGKITLTKDGRSIILHIGKSEIIVDGKTEYFEGAVPMTKNSRTFLPASKLAEILGIQVVWDGTTRTATFTSE